MVHFRSDSFPSPIENLDILQNLLPTPLISEMIEQFEKPKTLTILNELFNAANEQVKEN